MATERPMGGGDKPRAEPHASRALRLSLMLLGWYCVGLGVVGIFLPVLPTTPFLLVALWAFSRSSVAFHDWLYSHPRLGCYLRDWHHHRVIPPRAKLLSVSMMLASWLYVAFVVEPPWYGTAAMGATLLTVGVYIVTRPGMVPHVGVAVPGQGPPRQGGDDGRHQGAE